MAEMEFVFYIICQANKFVVVTLLQVNPEWNKFHKNVLTSHNICRKLYYSTLLHDQFLFFFTLYTFIIFICSDYIMCCYGGILKKCSTIPQGFEGDLFFTDACRCH